MAVLHDNVAAYEQSLTCYRRMEALAERTRDRETFAMVANCIGVTLHRMGRYEDAIEAHLKHRKVATSTAAHIYALCNEGLAQRVLGNFSRAVLCHRHALDAALESNDVAGEGLASGHLGFDYTAWLTRAASVTAAEASLAHEAGTAFLERYMELSETRPVRRDYNALLNAFLVARGEEKDGARAGGAGSAQPLPLLEHAIAGLFMIDSHSPPPPSLSLSLSLFTAHHGERCGASHGRRLARPAADALRPARGRYAGLRGLARVHRAAQQPWLPRLWDA